MTNHRIAVVVLFVFLPGLNCTDISINSGFSGPIPRGAYAYSSFDSVGAPIVNGWLTMVFSDSGSISGEWHLRSIGNPEGIGPQTGDGVLIGGTEDTLVWVELNPQFRDHNLELRGSLNGTQYHGRWLWISFVGVTNSGPFNAVKK
jgi:hypothetical protein